MIRSAPIAMALAVAAAVATWGTDALAAFPSAARIADAVAMANRAEGRSEPVLLDVTLSIGDGPTVATGTLATHPTGLARLELHSRQGFVERHLLQGSHHLASRDGEMIDAPRHFLPPLFLLQATSGAALNAALASFGIDNEQVVLGRVGDFDCYVLGGRLAPTMEQQNRVLPSMWIDQYSYEVVRIDGRDGVRYRLGPVQDFSGIRVPRWVTIEAPGEPRARLEIVGAASANAPAAAFGRDWLLAPTEP